MKDLLDSIKLGYISHAYILVGVQEALSDKAILLAQVVNCNNKDDIPCEFCESCRKIKKNIHPDVFHIYPDGATIKIDQIRNLVLSFAKPPLEGSKKVYIIHEAHKMTVEAQNSFLKTLEEPITDSIAIMLVENVKQLLPTVISRCQVYDFSRIAKSNISIETQKKLCEIIISVLKKDKLEIYKIANEILSLEEKLEDILEFLSSIYRDFLVVKAKSKASLINEDLQDFIINNVKHISIFSIISSIEIIFHQIKAAKSKGNKNLIIYNLFIELQEVL